MKKLLLLMFAASLVFVSCQRGLESEVTNEPLTLSVSELSYEDGAMEGSLPTNHTDPATGFYAQWGRETTPVSRVTEDSFQNGDDIGVYIHSAKPMVAGNIHSVNMRYVTSDKGATWRAANAMSGALTATAYFATAYHPYQATIANIAAVPHAVLLDQSAAQSAVQGNLEKSDFMSVSDAVLSDIATSPAATLNFVHRMSKFQIKIGIPSFIDGTAVTTLKSVTIKGLKDKGTVNLTNGVATVSTLAADKKDITPRKLSGTNAAGTTSTYEAVVFPQTVAAEELLVEFVCTVAGAIDKTLSYVVPASTTLSFVSGKRLILTLSSAADVAFMSDLDLLDGLAQSKKPLSIKAPLAAAWTLTSPVDWLTLSLTANGAYSKEIRGTGTGVVQTVYVNVAANNTQAVANWKPREATLTFAATTTPASTPASYLVVQGYNRFEILGQSITLISNTPLALPSVVSNQVWKLKGTLPAWLKITTAPVAWSAANAGNTIAVTAAGYDVVGSTTLYAVADPNTLTVLGGTTTTGITSATVALTYGDSPINVHWTHSFKTKGTVWASGNLVSVNATAANTAGQGGARIGSMYDGGLYFRFGSLVGLKGGANGSGVGTAVASHDTGYWLRPTGNTNTEWSNAAYFTGAQTSGEFNALVEDNATSGVGDACRYYLGAPWRMPTTAEFVALCNDKGGISVNVNWAASGGKETSLTTTPATNLYGGWWDGTAAFTAALASSTYFVGSGYRPPTTGALTSVGTHGVYWSSSINSATNGLYLSFYAGGVGPQHSNSRTHGFTLRCVQ